MCQHIDMVCIQCGQITRVVNSRSQKRVNQVWRRRLCQVCGAVFSTEESAKYSRSWAVKGRSGKLTAFSRDKLFLSLFRSCQHRKRAVNDASALTDTLIKKLATSVSSGVIDSRAIKQVVQVTLNRFDKAASTHYQAFHN